jgi:alkylation response protein AidB-like acyl-CoA dehydrogenase
MSQGPSLSALERAVAYSRVRRELRAEHRQLSPAQIDRIAELVVELRLARVRLGVGTESDESTFRVAHQG